MPTRDERERERELAAGYGLGLLESLQSLSSMLGTSNLWLKFGHYSCSTKKVDFHRFLSLSASQLHASISPKDTLFYLFLAYASLFSLRNGSYELRIPLFLQKMWL